MDKGEGTWSLCLLVLLLCLATFTFLMNSYKKSCGSNNLYKSLLPHVVRYAEYNLYSLISFLIETRLLF